MENPKAFFAHLRKQDSGVFGAPLSFKQVDGINAILTAAKGQPLDHVANCLAQVHRETGGGMYPVKETVYMSSTTRNPSDKTVIDRLNEAFANGQLSWVRTPYWRGGFFGRGQIQLTHKSNYRKMSKLVGVDLVANPSAALRLDVSAKVAALGMVTGAFTGAKLSDYDGPTFDHIGARSIVNGDAKGRDKGSTKTVGQIIHANALSFTLALEAGGWTATQNTQQPLHGILALLAALLKGFKA